MEECIEPAQPYAASGNTCCEKCLRAQGLRALWATFALTYGVKSIVVLLSCLRSGRPWLPVLLSFSHARICLFASVLTGGSQLLHYVLHKGVCWSSLAAGLGSGLVGILLESPGRRTVLAMYSIARALSYLWSHWSKHGVVPEVPYGSVWLFQLCCAEIMYCWVYHPETLPPSYVKWITLMADMDLDQKQAVMNYANGLPVDVADYCARNSLPNVNPYERFIPCIYVHPSSGMSCNHYSARRFFEGFARSLMLYLPVHVLPTIIFRWRAVLADPAGALATTTIGVVRSCAFLATFITIQWRAMCLVRNMFREDLRLGPAVGAALDGLSLFLEQPARRPELAMFVLPRAMQSVTIRIARALGITRPSWPNVVIFSVAFGIITYCHANCKDSLKPSHTRLLNRVLGKCNCSVDGTADLPLGSDLPKTES